MRLAMRPEMQSSPSTNWSELSQRLHRVARALTGSAHDADDLVQATLAHLLDRRPERVEHFGYLRTTLVRQWIAQRRRLRRRAARLGRWALDLVTRTDWSDSLDGQEQVSAALRAVERLPAQQRAVLVLRLVEDLSYEAIAAVLGCSLEAVRASMHLARRRLRVELGELP